MPTIFKAFRCLDRAAFWWSATAIWATGMFQLSTEAFSSDRSGAMLLAILGLFHADVSAGTLKILNVLVRSFAHVAEYCVLSLLLYRCFAGKRGFQWHRPAAHACVSVAFVYALTDELHQALVPGRGSSLLDCTIDALGIGIAILLVYVASRRAGFAVSPAPRTFSAPIRRS
jgi:VanZ family protein